VTPGEVAGLLVAAATFITSVAGLVVAVRSSGTAARTHDLVNGQSQRLEAMNAASARESGFQAGVRQERDRPPS